MKRHLTFSLSFFVRLSTLVGLIAIGCASNDAVNPLEKTSGEEDLYFWSGMKGDEKVFLNLDPVRRLYRLENAGDAESIINELKAASPQVSIQGKVMGESTFLLVDKGDAFASFPDSEKVKFQVPVYTSKQTGYTYFFDGVIILRPKEGLNIHDILDGETGVKLKEKLSSGTHFCFVEDGEKVLTVANRIFENGLVDFCYHNYVPPLVLN